MKKNTMFTHALTRSKQQRGVRPARRPTRETTRTSGRGFGARPASFRGGHLGDVRAC